MWKHTWQPVWVCVQIQLYSWNQGAGRIGPVSCGLPTSALATGGIGAGAQRREERRFLQPAASPHWGHREPPHAASFLGLEAGSSPRPAGLDEINVPRAYWAASLCPVSLLPNPVHPFASSCSLLSSNGSIWIWCQFPSSWDWGVSWDTGYLGLNPKQSQGNQGHSWDPGLSPPQPIPTALVLALSSLMWVLALLAV